MADKYWVGGTANWDLTVGSKWASTSGGAGGQAIPTSADDVYFDAASGAITCTKTTNEIINSLDFTGFTGTFAGGLAYTITIDDTKGLVLGAGMTHTSESSYTFSDYGDQNITCNGVSLASIGYYITKTNSGQLILQDELDIGYAQLSLNNFGGLNTNDQTLSCLILARTGGAISTVTLGASILNIRSLNFASAATVLDAGTSSIHFTGASGINANSLTFNEIQINGDDFSFSGSNTFASVIASASVRKIIFVAGETTTITDLSIVGDKDNWQKIESSTSTNSTVSCTNAPSLWYCTFKDVDFTGAGVAEAYNSMIVSDVSGVRLLNPQISTTVTT